MTEPVYHWNIEQGSDQWHDLRRGLITASAISRLITATGKPASNDTSRGQLYQLLAERITGTTEPSFYNDDMARGHLLEPYARDLYQKHYGEVKECGFITRKINGITLGYSPDGLVGDHGLIEIKSPRAKTHLKSLLTNEVPAEYVPQVQTGLAVSGRVWCDYVSYVPGLPLFRKRCNCNASMINSLVDAAVAAEEQLTGMMEIYKQISTEYPPTEVLHPEQEIVV